MTYFDENEGQRTVTPNDAPKILLVTRLSDATVPCDIQFTENGTGVTISSYINKPAFRASRGRLQGN